MTKDEMVYYLGGDKKLTYSAFDIEKELKEIDSIEPMDDYFCDEYANFADIADLLEDVITFIEEKTNAKKGCKQDKADMLLRLEEGYRDLTNSCAEFQNSYAKLEDSVNNSQNVRWLLEKIREEKMLEGINK